MIDRFALSLPASALLQAPTVDTMAVLVIEQLMREVPMTPEDPPPS